MLKKVFILSLFIAIATTQNSFALRDMRITSDDIDNGKNISEEFVYSGFGCKGKNLSPSLEFVNVPSDAKSLALTVYDPDAPTGSGWWHWVVYDIDPNTTKVERGSSKIGANSVVARNDFGEYKYGGPCPPKGSNHRYIFTLYALSVEKLPVPRDASAALIGYNLNANAIKKISIIPRYNRKK